MALLPLVKNARHHLAGGRAEAERGRWGRGGSADPAESLLTHPTAQNPGVGGELPAAREARK